MNIYVKEVHIPPVFNFGSIVEFIMNTGENISYRVNYGFMNELYCNNDKIFNVLGITNKYDFIKKVIGYHPITGSFPVVKSLEDLEKIVKALAEYRPKEVIVKKEEKFTISVKKHKQTKLNFQL